VIVTLGYLAVQKWWPAAAQLFNPGFREALQKEPAA
jgi:hypothetical protein